MVGRRRSALAAATLATIAATSPAFGDDPWSDIRKHVFGDREILAPAEGQLALYALRQAADGARVPVSVQMPTALATRAARLTLIIDRNPAPVAAVVHFGDGWRREGAIGDRIFSTRVRVDAFSQMRAIVETTDGQLIAVERFVAGAGGCSSQPSKDMALALAELGKAKVTLNAGPPREDDWREGQVMIRHPNFTGMQMDSKSGSFTPARYVSEIEVSDGENVLFRVDGSISLSEDPHLRFTYPGASKRLHLKAADSDGLEIDAQSFDPPS